MILKESEAYLNTKERESFGIIKNLENIYCIKERIN